MQAIPLTYDLLKEALPDLNRLYIETVPKMTNRAIFKPEFSGVYLLRPVKPEHVAVVSISIIEAGPGFNTMPKWYTKDIRYGVHENSVVERLNETVWGSMPEATAYMEPVAKWATAIRYPQHKIAPMFCTKPPTPPTTVPTEPKPAAPVLPERKADHTYCPKGDGHLYSEPTVAGYSWHGPVRTATCINCGYVFCDH